MDVQNSEEIVAMFAGTTIHSDTSETHLRIQRKLLKFWNRFGGLELSMHVE